MPSLLEVQTAKGHQKYTTRYTFTDGSLTKAYWWYKCINTHSGYKKRLLLNGKVIRRCIT